MKFSERLGKTPVKSLLQIESIDEDLLNRLWNLFLEKYFDKLYIGSEYDDNSQKLQFCSYLWKELLKKPIDEFPQSLYGLKSAQRFIEYFREWYFTAEWYEVYDFIELLCQLDTASRFKFHFSDYCNIALKFEVAGYRILNDNVVQITTEEEIIAIEEALFNTDKWTSAKTHLNEALNSLADRKNPNYRNSIKESISAVEAVCKIITGDDKATLGKALSEIQTKHKLHGALKTAFSAIYGYTSDSGGIRHSLLEKDSIVDADEAKFMIISCSAFINYLIAKSN